MCSAQQMTCNAQHTPCKMRKTSCSMHYGSMHYAADATANNRSRATCTKQRATCKRHRAENSNQQATCRMQQTTDSRRRATDSRRHARGRVKRAYTCELQRETHGTAAFRARRAAGSAQPAACAKHCTRQPLRSSLRNTARTPHTRCNIRPVPQHAANSDAKTRGEAKEIRKLAHLGACVRPVAITFPQTHPLR
jgi:hypothetical protein